MKKKLKLKKEVKGWLVIMLLMIGTIAIVNIAADRIGEIENNPHAYDQTSYKIK